MKASGWTALESAERVVEKANSAHSLTTSLLFLNHFMPLKVEQNVGKCWCDQQEARTWMLRLFRGQLSETMATGSVVGR